MLLGLQQLLLPGGGVGQQLVPEFHERIVSVLDGLGLDVFGRQELVFQGRDVGNSLLLESLQASVEGFLGKARRQALHPRPRCGPQVQAAATPHNRWQLLRQPFAQHPNLYWEGSGQQRDGASKNGQREEVWEFGVGTRQKLEPAFGQVGKQEARL